MKTPLIFGLYKISFMNLLCVYSVRMKSNFESFIAFCLPIHGWLMVAVEKGFSSNYWALMIQSKTLPTPISLERRIRFTWKSIYTESENGLPILLVIFTPSPKFFLSAVIACLSYVYMGFNYLPASLFILFYYFLLVRLLLNGVAGQYI